MNDSRRRGACALVCGNQSPPTGACAWGRISARQDGYTLQEALVAAVIAGLLLTGAAGFARLFVATRVSSQINALIADLNLARLEAIKRGQAVTVCKSDSGDSCSETSAWHDGWIVFTDPNENSVIDEDETVLRIGQGFEGGTAVTFSAFGPGTGDYVNYTSIGATKQNGTFKFCNMRASGITKAIKLIQTGRARITLPSETVSCP